MTKYALIKILRAIHRVEWGKRQSLTTLILSTKHAVLCAFFFNFLYEQQVINKTKAILDEY